MIRKIDFKSGERFLQRLPYVSLPSDLAYNMRKQSLILAERCHYYFQNTAINYSIKQWQQKIIDYTENQHRIPFPIFRLSDYWQSFITQEYVSFQSARGETFHLPTRLSKDLAYFLGAVIGDGHLNYHNIGLVKKFDETWVQAAYRLKERLVKNSSDFLPEILPTDKLIISHTHVPFYDMDNGVFATGSWIIKEKLRENEDFIKRNIGVFIVIDDEDRHDPIKMKKFFQL